MTRRLPPVRPSRRLGHRDRIEWHDHIEHQIVYPRVGVLIATTPSGTWTVPPQRAVWLPAEVPHSHQAHGPTDVRSIGFPRETSARTRPTLLAVSPLMREAIVALTGPDALTERERANIQNVVLDQLRPLPDGPLYLPEPRDDRLQTIYAALNDDPADGRSLRELGSEVGAAERTLSRLFRAQTGMTFPQWRAQLRLHHALRHLAAGLPVTAVAHRCGYANASAFIEAFRLAMGTTPGAYQKTLTP